MTKTTNSSIKTTPLVKSKSGGDYMRKTSPSVNQHGRTHYDKLQLLRLNNIALSQGLISAEMKQKMERQIWAS